MKLRNIFLCATIALTGIVATAQERKLEIYQKGGAVVEHSVAGVDSIAFSSPATAQERALKIYQKEGTTLEYLVANIDSVKFSPSTTPQREGCVLIKAAGETFTMGYSEMLSYYKEEWCEHEVTFTKDFFLEKYEVTNGQFAEFLNAEGYIGVYYQTGYYALMNNDLSGNTIVYNEQTKGLYWDVNANKWTVEKGFENHPAIYISWYGANEYAKWKGGYLPTEAQWEYACRAGTTTDFFFGDVVQKLDMTLGMFIYEGLHDYAIVDSNYDRESWTGSQPGTEAVGSKAPNPWGLYDMCGNVGEWCSDWYGDYPTEAVTDPTGPANGELKVRRGGSWAHDGICCASGFRSSDEPNYGNSTYGFRVAYDVE